MKKMIALLALSFVGFAHGQSPPSLSDIQIELGTDLALPLGNSIKAELFTNKPTSLVTTLRKFKGIKLIETSKNSVTLQIPQRYAFDGKPTNDSTSDTFVIDYKEDSVNAFVSNFTEQHSDKNDENPRLPALERFVSTYINDPTYIHGFKIASVIANQRSGDCTEYAVLLTALARAFDIPAKVVLGTVIVEQHGKINAYGHAWVEAFKEGTWHILDAALYSEIGIKRFYIPAAHIQNEGPGYAFGLVGAVALLPQKISLQRAE